MNENTAEFWNLFLLQQNVTRYFYLLLVVAVKTGQSVTFCSHNQNKQTRSKLSAASRNFGCIALRWSGSGSAIKDDSDHMCSSLKEAMNLLPEWIHQFLWCTMIWGILDLWSWSRLPQKFPLYSIMYHIIGCFVYLLLLCFSQFGGFSAESLAERILDSTCKVLVTAGKWIIVISVYLTQLNEPVIFFECWNIYR